MSCCNHRLAVQISFAMITGQICNSLLKFLKRHRHQLRVAMPWCSEVATLWIAKNSRAARPGGFQMGGFPNLDLSSFTPKSPESEILVRIFADIGEKFGKKLAKNLADFRHSISRTIGCKNFHEKCSVKYTGHEMSIFHRETLGAWRHNPSGTNLCTRDFAPPKPEFGPEFWGTNFGRTNFGPEFLGRMFWACFSSKRGSQRNSPSRNSPKFNPEIGPKNSHCTSAGPLTDNPSFLGPFSSFLGLFPTFLEFFRFVRGLSGIFQIGAFPLSRPINSTYEEHSQKGSRHNPDLSRKKWETPRFGNPPPPRFACSQRTLLNYVHDTSNQKT